MSVVKGRAGMITSLESVKQLRDVLIVAAEWSERHGSQRITLFDQQVTTDLSLADLAALLVSVLGVSMTAGQVEAITKVALRSTLKIMQSDISIPKASAS